MSNVTETQVPGESPAPTAETAAQATETAAPAATKKLIGAKTAAQASREALELPNGPLPDASDVNPDKIARATLTKQGWVVPTAKQHPAQRA
jgi:uncharacterized protein YijF (DUF1287 family)